MEDALDELDPLAPDERAELPVAIMRLDILKAMERWDSAAILAESLIEMGVDQSLHLSCLRDPGARSLPEAKAMLLKGEPLLHGEALWWYNLACYDCQLGAVEAAKARLARAFEIDRCTEETEILRASLATARLNRLGGEGSMHPAERTD